MGNKLPYTPNTKIRAMVRQLFLRSREHAAALKNMNNCCALCGVKKSTAKGREVKLNVHHLRPPNWSRIFRVIRDEMLQTPEELAPLCVQCHKSIHETESERDADVRCMNHKCRFRTSLGCTRVYDNGLPAYKLCQDYEPEYMIDEPDDM